MHKCCPLKKIVITVAEISLALLIQYSCGGFIDAKESFPLRFPFSHLVVPRSWRWRPRRRGRGGPLEGPAGEDHVPDERLDGRLPHQADEEELLDDGGGHGAQGGQAEEELAKPGKKLQNSIAKKSSWETVLCKYLVGCVGYWLLQYSSSAHWDRSCICSIAATSERPQASVEKGKKEGKYGLSIWRRKRDGMCGEILSWLCFSSSFPLAPNS